MEENPSARASSPSAAASLPQGDSSAEATSPSADTTTDTTTGTTSTSATAVPLSSAGKKVSFSGDQLSGAINSVPVATAGSAASSTTSAAAPTPTAATTITAQTSKAQTTTTTTTTTATKDVVIKSRSGSLSKTNAPLHHDRSSGYSLGGDGGSGDGGDFDGLDGSGEQEPPSLETAHDHQHDGNATSMHQSYTLYVSKLDAGVGLAVGGGVELGEPGRSSLLFPSLRPCPCTPVTTHTTPLNPTPL